MPLAQENKGFLRAVGARRTKTTKRWQQSPVCTVSFLGPSPSLPFLPQPTSLLQALEISSCFVGTKGGKSVKVGES